MTFDVIIIRDGIYNWRGQLFLVKLFDTTFVRGQVDKIEEFQKTTASASKSNPSRQTNSVSPGWVGMGKLCIENMTKSSSMFKEPTGLFCMYVMVHHDARLPPNYCNMTLPACDIYRNNPCFSITVHAYICIFIASLVSHSISCCCCCCCFSHSAHWLPTRKKLLYPVANPARGLLNRDKEKG